MSEKSYFKVRPGARIVYEERERQEREKNLEILGKGLNFAAAILGVFGVCMGKIELILLSATMLLLEKTLCN